MKYLKLCLVGALSLSLYACNNISSVNIDFSKMEEIMNQINEDYEGDFFTNKFTYSLLKSYYQNIYEDRNGNVIVMQIFNDNFTSVESEVIEEGNLNNKENEILKYKVFENIKSSDVIYDDTISAEELSIIKKTEMEDHNVVVEGYYDDYMIRIFGNSSKDELLKLLTQITFNTKITDHNKWFSSKK